MGQARGIARVLTLFSLTLLAAALPGRACAQTPAATVDNPWRDPRFVAWSKEINAGAFDTALAEVEKDLVSPAPHPFSVDVWCRLHLRRHDLDAAAAAVTDPRLREVLGVAPKLYSLEDDGKWQELAALGRSLKPGEIRGAFTYRLLLEAGLERRTHDFDLALRALRTQTPIFINVWLTTNAIDEDNAYRNRVEQELKTDPPFSASLAGRLLAFYLHDVKDSGSSTQNCANREPDKENAFVALGDRWLQQYPGDASAIAWKMFYQDNLGQDPATLNDEANASLDAYPLIRLGAAVQSAMHADFRDAKTDEPGKALSERFNRMREADAAVAEAEAIVMDADAVRDGVRCDSTPRSATARAWVSDLLAKSGAASDKVKSTLLAELAELDLADRYTPGATQTALREAREADALGGKDGHKTILLKALTATKDPKNLAEAVEIYQRALPAYPDHSETFFSAADRLLKLAGSCKDREDNWRAALKERPRSDTALYTLLQEQQECGDADAAQETLRIGYDVDRPEPWNLWAWQFVTAQLQGLEALAARRKALEAASPVGFKGFTEPTLATVLKPEAPASPPALKLVPQSPPSPPVAAMALSLNGALAATADARGVIGIWTLDPPHHTAGAGQTAMSQLAPEESSVHLLRTMYAHVGRIGSLEFTADGQFLVSTGRDDGAVKVWRVATGAFLWGLVSADGSAPRAAIRPAVRPANGTPAEGLAVLLRRPADGTDKSKGWAQVSLCAISSAESCKSFTWYTNWNFKQETVTSLAWSSDGERLAARLFEEQTLLIDATRMKLLSSGKTPADASFNKDLSAYLTVADDTLQLQSFAPDAKPTAITRLEGQMLQASLLEDGRVRYAVSAGEFGKRTIEIQETAGAGEGKPELRASLPESRFPAPILGQLNRPDRFTVFSAALAASGDRNGPPLAVVYLKPAGATAEVQMFAGTSSPVPNEVAFTAGSRELVVSRGDNSSGAVDLWDLAQSGQPIVPRKKPAVGPSSAVTAEGLVSCVALPSGEAVVLRYDAAGMEVPAATHEHCLPRTPVLALSGANGVAWFDRIDGLVVDSKGAPLWRTGSMAQGEVVRAVTASAQLALAATDHDLYLVRRGEKPVDLCDDRCPSGNAAFARIAITLDGRYAIAAVGAIDAHTVPPPSTGYGVMVFDLEKTNLRLEQEASGSQHAAVTSVAFLPGTTGYVFGTADGRVLLADATRPGSRLLFAQDSSVAALNVSDDARYLAVALDSGSVLLSRFAGQAVKPLARLDTFADGDWSVVTAEGQYDAAGGGQLQDLLWVFGDSTVQLDQMEKEYYRSRLLPRLMGFETAELRPSRPLDQFQPQLPPTVTQMRVDAEKGELSFTTATPVQDIAEVRVFLNGAAVRTSDLQLAPGNVVKARLAGSRTFTPGEINHVVVELANHDRTIHSRDAEADFPAPGVASLEKPQFYAILSGISTYAGGLRPLPLADADAREMAVDVARGATHLLGSPDRVHIFLLTTDEAEGRRTQQLVAASKLGTVEWMAPSHANFVAAFNKLKAAGLKKNDIFLMFLAGHGLMLNKQYIYPTREFDKADPQHADSFLSASVLTASLENVKANHTVLLFDTCNSGGMIGGMAASDAEPAAATDAEKEELKDLQSDLKTAYLLMGAGANEKAYDNDLLHHGFLTAGLLLSMREHGRDLFASEWLDSAYAKTRAIAAHYGYQQDTEEFKMGDALEVAALPTAELDCIPDFSFAPLIEKPTLKHGLHRENSLSLAVTDLLLARQSSGNTPAVYESEGSIGAHISTDGQYEIDPQGHLHLSLTFQYGDGAEQTAPPIDMIVDSPMSAAQEKDLAARIVDSLYRFATDTVAAERAKVKPAPPVCSVPFSSAAQ